MLNKALMLFFPQDKTTKKGEDFMHHDKTTKKGGDLMNDKTTKKGQDLMVKAQNTIQINRDEMRERLRFEMAAKKTK